MTKLRDYLMIVVALSAAEGYGVIHFAPQFRPTGGLGRLGFRLFLINFGLIIIYRVLIYPFFVSPLRKIPGPPPGNLIIGHGMWQFSKPPGDKIREVMDTVPNDGLLYWRSFFNQPIVVPTQHETLKTVLSDNTYDYEKPQNFVGILRRILGDGLILVEGSVHKFQRKRKFPRYRFEIAKTY